MWKKKEIANKIRRNKMHTFWKSEGKSLMWQEKQRNFEVERKKWENVHEFPNHLTVIRELSSAERKGSHFWKVENELNKFWKIEWAIHQKLRQNWLRYIYMKYCWFGFYVTTFIIYLFFFNLIDLLFLQNKTIIIKIL